MLSLNDIEPRKHLFVLKQHYLPQRRPPTVISFADPPPTKGPENQQRSSRYMYHYAKGPDQREYLSLVEHFVTREGIACIKFDVVLSQPNRSSQPQTRVLLLNQNQQTLATNLRVPGDPNIYVFMLATQDRLDTNRKLKITVDPHLEWIVEFASFYKVLQFLQMVKLFKTRAVAKLNEEQITSESYRYLIPPQIFSKIMMLQESPSNNQDQQKNQVEYLTGQVALSIFCVTWNQARTSQVLDLQNLFPNKSQYNIIAFGVQECVRAEKESQVESIKQFLGQEFVQIDYVGKGQMYLVVFVKRRDAIYISGNDTNYKAIDAVGYGFKGGVMVQLTIYDMKISFINCHLTSGQNAIKQRLKMSSDLLKSIACISDKELIEQDAIHDFNFFMGDLNFRINRTYTQHIPFLQDSPALVDSLDQLALARENLGIFPGYVEEPITFMPTYKRNFDSNEYTNKKEQCPSYTDRILFKNNSNAYAHCTQYGCHEDYWGSDHRPVFVKMEIKTKPVSYIDPSTLLNPQLPVQGRGEIRFKNVKLNLNSDRMQDIQRTFTYPMFLQLHFRSDWLITKPVSYQKVISSPNPTEQRTRHWKDYQIPKLYTPINSAEILQQKRLLVSIKLFEGSNNNAESFAYVNLDMSNLEKADQERDINGEVWQYIKVFASEPVIGYNTQLGDFQAVLQFRVNGQSELPKDVMPDSNTLLFSMPHQIQQKRVDMQSQSQAKAGGDQYEESKESQQFMGQNVNQQYQEVTLQDGVDNNPSGSLQQQTDIQSQNLSHERQRGEFNQLWQQDRM